LTPDPPKAVPKSWTKARKTSNVSTHRPGKVVINDNYSQQTNFVPIITTPCSNLVLRIDCPGSSNRLFLSNFNYQQTWISRIVKTEPVGGTTFPPMALALARSTGVVTGAPLKGGRRHQGVSPFYNCMSWRCNCQFML
jgi:hypothetical protein